MSLLADPAPGPSSGDGIAASAFSNVAQAVTGLRNRRAIVALLGCAVVGVIVSALVMTMTVALGFLAGLLAMLVWFVAIGTGVNAAGVLQMDEARGISPRSTVDALVYGLMCIPKVIVLGLACLAVEVIVFIAIGVLLLLCKIPLLGPLLFVLVFPLSVLAAGLTVVGVLLFMVLALPAIWQGATLTRALAQALAILRSRLVDAVLLLVVLVVLCAVVGFVVFGVLAAGLVPTLGLSASILGFSGFADVGALVGGGPGFAGGRYIASGVIGGLLLWAVAGSLVGQVYLRGLSIAYLRVSEGLDMHASESALRATFDEARRRTAELGEKAKSAAHREPAASVAVPITAAALAPSSSHSEPMTNPDFAPTYEPPPAVQAAKPYNPPPAYSAPPAASPVTAADGAGHIDLPFGDEPTAVPRPTPAYASPPAWTPPPVAPAVAPLPAPAAATTCPQCLSPLTPDDVFCGVCGYRVK